MPPFTALLHTKNDALRLGRALETLVPCGEILVVDHHSADATGRIAREYGARLVAADSQANPQRYLELARFDWIFCLDPGDPSLKVCKQACSNGARCRATGL